MKLRSGKTPVKGSQAEMPNVLTIPAALDNAAKTWGDQVAYVEGTGNRFLTWRDLSDRANVVAAGLVRLGLTRSDRVAICGENSLEWITALQAILVAGASAVLVYHDQKGNEIGEQVSRPGCRFLFATKRALQQIDGAIPGVEQTIQLERSEDNDALTLETVARLGGDNATSTAVVGPDDLAAIIYTSGTTGGPKGVMLSHRNLLAEAHSVATAMALDSRDSALLVLPLHHSLAFMVAGVLPLYIGGKIIIENDLRRIRDRLQMHHPTIFFGVPALYELMYRSILARAEAEGRLRQLQRLQSVVRLVKRLFGINVGPLVFNSIHKALGGHLRFMISGAAALKPQTALDYFSLGLPLLQGAGVSESSSAFAAQRFSRRRFLFSRYYERHVGSIGPALPGVDVRLIDVPEKRIRVAERGEGELLLRGASVFNGYWQAPEATEAALTDGWLRTGDLARIEKDGSIYLTGRAKYIIVLDSGEKIYPDEVEEKLGASPLIEDICVTSRRIREKIVATAVIYPSVEATLEAVERIGSKPDAATVQSLIAAEVSRMGGELADYKRVGEIELTDEPLPKTALRKIARGRLAAHYSFDYAKWLSGSSATTTGATSSDSE